MNENRKKISTEQLNLLVTEVLSDKSLCALKGRNKMRDSTIKEKWDALADKLNAVENGDQRNVAKWQQTWRDFKSNTKKKANRGSSSELTDLELQVLQMDNSDTAPVQEGIDTRSIVEVDPLSSDDEPFDQDNVVAPDMVTVYSARGNNVKRSNSDTENGGGIKRQRTNLFCDTNTAREIVDALSSIVALGTRETQLLEKLGTHLGILNTNMQKQMEILSRGFESLGERLNK